MAETRPLSIVRPRFALAMLALIYAVSFVDRQLTSILATPIKLQFHLTDTQLGFLGGPSFALLYAVLGLPAAWLADRTNRTWIITAALALWSGFTALTGLATTIPLLFAARIGVGVGEAGGVAPSYALIADYFPERQRARAMAVYAMGAPTGGAVGVLLGGVIGQAMGWRFAFLATGLVGVILAPLFRLLVREPAREGPAVRAPSTGATAAAIVRSPSFWGLALSAAIASMGAFGAAFWLPSFFGRIHHLPLAQVGLLQAGIFLVGGLIGLPAAGWLADRLGVRSKAAYALMPAAAFVLAIPCYAIGLITPSLPLAVLLFTLGQALGLTWMGPLPAAVQQLVAPRMRATASAVFLFTVAILGQCIGAVVMGAVSDHLRDRLGEGALRAGMLATPGFYLLAAIVLALTAGRLAKDWRAPQTPNG